MSKVRRMFALGVLTLAVAAGVAGTTTLFARPAQAKPCKVCPLTCPGVICDDGNFYCNTCLGRCNGAHKCGLAG